MRCRWAGYEEADRLLLGAVAPSGRGVSRKIQEWERVYPRTLSLFFMLTGARVSEALKLRWEDVDLQQRWLVFHSTKRKKKPRTRRAMRRPDDRGGEDRGVPIHPQLQIALANLTGEHATDRVFLTRHGRGYTINSYGSGQIKKGIGWSLSARRHRGSDAARYAAHLRHMAAAGRRRPTHRQSHHRARRTWDGRALCAYSRSRVADRDR